MFQLLFDVAELEARLDEYLLSNLITLEGCYHLLLSGQLHHFCLGSVLVRLFQTYTWKRDWLFEFLVWG
jgi:hypothetical protein